MEPVTADLCSRIRAYVSLELDGELSELERSILEAHVDDCRACRSFRCSVEDLTSALRTAPLEGMSYPFVASRRRGRLAVLSAGTTTAAAAVAAAAVVGIGFTSSVVTADRGQEHGARTTTQHDLDESTRGLRPPDSSGGTMRVL